MPQMAPLNWLTLFIFFICIFLIFNMMTYFVFLYTPLKNKFNTKTSQINWKW